MRILASRIFLIAISLLSTIMLPYARADWPQGTAPAELEDGSNKVASDKLLWNHKIHFGIIDGLMSDSAELTYRGLTNVGQDTHSGFFINARDRRSGNRGEPSSVIAAHGSVWGTPTANISPSESQQASMVPEGPAAPPVGFPSISGRRSLTAMFGRSSPDDSEIYFPTHVGTCATAMTNGLGYWDGESDKNTHNGRVYSNISDMVGIFGGASLHDWCRQMFEWPVTGQIGKIHGARFEVIPQGIQGGTGLIIQSAIGLSAWNIFDNRTVPDYGATYANGHVWSVGRTCPVGQNGVGDTKDLASTVENLYGGRFRTGIEGMASGSAGAGSASIANAFGVHSTVVLGAAGGNYTQGEISEAYAVYSMIDDAAGRIGYNPGDQSSPLGDSWAFYAVGDMDIGTNLDNESLVTSSNRVLSVNTSVPYTQTNTTVKRFASLAGVTGALSTALASHGTRLQISSGSASGICPTPFLHEGDKIKGFGFAGSASGSGSVTVRLYKHADSDGVLAEPQLIDNAVMTSSDNPNLPKTRDLSQLNQVTEKASYSFEIELAGAAEIKSVFLTMDEKKY